MHLVVPCVSATASPGSGLGQDEAAVRPWRAPSRSLPHAPESTESEALAADGTAETALRQRWAPAPVARRRSGSARCSARPQSTTARVAQHDTRRCNDSCTQSTPRWPRTATPRQARSLAGSSRCRHGTNESAGTPWGSPERPPPTPAGVLHNSDHNQRMQSAAPDATAQRAARQAGRTVTT
jgi:hypothetical protein